MAHSNGGRRGRKDGKQEENGDGKFDQDTIPGPVQLAVGRVDLSRMPAFEADETTLLRQYLNRNHAWRHGLAISSGI